MLMESQMEFCSPVNIPGASQEKQGWSVLLNYCSRRGLVLQREKAADKKKR